MSYRGDGVTVHFTPSPDWPSLRASTDHSSSILSLEGGLDGLPLRVPNEGLLRPRVARAQEVISSAHQNLAISLGSGQGCPYCAHQASTFLSCAFCE